MKPLIHPLWSSPPAEATDLQKQAHRMMLHILQRAAKYAEDVLAAPERVGGKRVMDAAMAASLNPKIAPELRTAALAMLQRRMAEVDAETPQRIFSLPHDYQNPISRSVGDELESLREFEAALGKYLVELRATDSQNATAERDTENALRALGILEALLVTRLGYCSVPLLGHVATAVGRVVWTAGSWAWVDLKFTYSRDPVQLRRIFLDPVALAAWMKVSTSATFLPTPKASTKANELSIFRTRLAKRAFLVLAKHMAATGCATAIRSLSQLCAAKAQHLRVTTMPLLATFAEGDIVSSSLEAGTWARLIGHELPPTQDSTSPSIDARSQAAETASQPLPPLSSNGGTGHETLAEQTLQGDLDEGGIIAQLRDVMRDKQPTWRAGFDALIKEMGHQKEMNDTARCVVSWLRYLAFERSNKGAALREGSIRNYRGLLANRLLLYLPTKLSGIDEEELLDAYLEVLESQASEAQGVRINAALASFHQYVRRDLIPDLPNVQLPGYGHGGYAISSRIISEVEFQRGRILIHDGRIALKGDALKQQTEAFWILGYRLGMRRREILGLQVRDVTRELVRVRKNEQRLLKTANARRVLPVCTVPAEEQKVLLRLIQDRAGQEFMFFGSKAPSPKALDSHPAVRAINEVLKRVSGDPKLHPHNLRHCTATSFLFGSLGKDLGLDSHPYLMAWMKPSFDHAAVMERAITGELHRKGGRGAALAMTMGHGSELTTYQHYVHCLDLLLFMACVATPRREGHHCTNQSRVAKDRTTIAALFRCSPKKIRTRRIPGVLAWISRRYPDRVLLLGQRDKFATEENEHTRDSAEGAWPLALEKLRDVGAAQLRNSKNAEVLRGAPEEQSEVDTVATVLGQFNRVAPESREGLRSALHRWKAAKMKDSDWASMKPDVARLWIKDIGRLGVPIAVDAVHVTRRGRNRKVKKGLMHPLDPKSYRSKRGTYWLRFAETRPKPHRRGRKTGQVRSRTQASITWLVDALLECTGGQASFDF